LCGRIVSLADVYDALTSKRTYKEAFAHHVARSIILEGSNSHFDPDVVDAFLQIENEFLSIRKQFASDDQATGSFDSTALIRGSMTQHTVRSESREGVPVTTPR
jgi:putative two-component system response regulator